MCGIQRTASIVPSTAFFGFSTLLNIPHPIQPFTQATIGSRQSNIWIYFEQSPKANSLCKWQLRSSKCISPPVFSAGGENPLPQPAPNWPVAAGLQSRVSLATRWQFCSRPGGQVTAPGRSPPGGVGSPHHWTLPGNLRARAQLSIPVSRAFPGPSSAGPALLATRAVDNIRDPTLRLLTQSGECDEGEFSGSGGLCSSRGGRLLVRGMLQLYARPK